jgi:hypothetical protein
VQAVKDYLTSGDNSLLSFRKNDIIKLVSRRSESNKNLIGGGGGDSGTNTTSYTPQGWLKGVLNNRRGLFPVEYVKQLSRVELNDLIKSGALTHHQYHQEINNNPQQPTAAAQIYHPVHQYQYQQHQQQQQQQTSSTAFIEDTNGGNSNEDLQTPNLMTQDGHYSMMEFAMMNFKQSIDK